MKGRHGKDEGWVTTDFIMLGIDLWDKRVWLATSIEWVVFPHSIVARVELVRVVKKLVKDKNIQTIVVGLPYDLFGNDTKQLDKTEKYIEKLTTIFPKIEVVGFDERFTSIEADSIKETFWNTKKELHKDDISAALILEWYISSQRN